VSGSLIYYTDPDPAPCKGAQSGAVLYEGDKLAKKYVDPESKNRCENAYKGWRKIRMTLLYF
jgi:hypothetical protein